MHLDATVLIHLKSWKLFQNILELSLGTGGKRICLVGECIAPHSHRHFGNHLDQSKFRIVLLEAYHLWGIGIPGAERFFKLTIANKRDTQQIGRTFKQGYFKLAFVVGDTKTCNFLGILVDGYHIGIGDRPIEAIQHEPRQRLSLGKGSKGQHDKAGEQSYFFYSQHGAGSVGEQVARTLLKGNKKERNWP